MKKRKLHIFVCILAFLTLFISFTQFSGPSKEEVGQTEKDISSDRAIEHLKKIAKEPHPIGSPANKKVRNYIEKYFQNLNIPVEIQSKSVMDIEGGKYAIEIGAENVENIIAKIQGTSDDNNAILLTAHYDSAPETPGAADDGYGVVTIMEAARALKQMPAPKNTIYFVLTDGEEQGLLGANALKDRKDILNQVRVIINLEARGNTGVPMLFQTSPNDLKLVQLYNEVVPYSIAYSFATEIYKKMPNDTDFTELKETVKIGYNFANIGGVETYHEKTDRIESVDEETMRHFGDFVLPLVKKYMMMDTKEFEILEESQGDAIYFPLMKKFLVVYSDEVVIPLMMVLLVLTVMTMFLSLKKQVLQMKGVILSLVSMIGSLVPIYIFNFLLVQLLTKVFDVKTDEDGLVMLDMYHTFILTLIVLLAIIFSAIFAKWITKKFGIMNFVMSTQILWVVLAVITSLIFKGISYAFTIPAIISLLLLLPIIVKVNWIKIIYHYVIITGWIVPSILLLAPTLYMIYVAKTVGIAPIIAIATSVIAYPTIAIVNGLMADDGEV